MNRVLDSQLDLILKHVFVRPKVFKLKKTQSLRIQVIIFIEQFYKIPLNAKKPPVLSHILDSCFSQYDIQSSLELNSIKLKKTVHALFVKKLNVFDLKLRLKFSQKHSTTVAEDGAVLLRPPMDNRQIRVSQNG